MESEHESESNEHLIKDADNSRNMDEALFPVMSAKKSDHDSRSEAEKYIDFNEETSGSAEMSKTSHSSSYSGSSSDYFQIDAKMPQKSSTFPVVSPEPQEDSQSKNHGQNSPSQPSSQVSQATNKSTLQTPSPIESPPIQVMEKAGGYDPNRIPDSVFGRSSSAMDWSVASNESLFSLHLGNNSFSREQFLLMSGELYSSGELNKPSEAAKPGRPPLIPIGKLQEEEAVDSDNKPKETKAAEEKMDDSLELDVSDQPEEKESEAEVNGHSSMINRPSDASGTSTQSFAFPILVDPTKTPTMRSDSMKGPSPREQDMQRAVYEDIVKLEAQTKSSSSFGCCCCCGCNCCSSPHCSCPSHQHCWSWKWCNKWFCCPCC
ncbi:uncharacterized protein LOC135147736 [Daucus carota subsp. sativus]|uniref:Uncharacterized protein n=1 Tax=Daucus carota subsp. sativus TaxID=79200 RepID=A0A161ZLK7_DAUCS